MKNASASFETFKTMRRLCFSRSRTPLYIALTAIFVLLNLAFISSIISTDGFLFDETDIYYIFWMFAAAGILVLIFIMTPSCLGKQGTEPFDKDVAEPSDTAYLEASTCMKILSLWIPICFYIIAQTMVFGICRMLYPSFKISLFTDLATCIYLCYLIFVWIMICVCLYFAARSVRSYLFGLAVLNLAPIVIIGGCFEVYNSNVLTPHKNWNPLLLNPFTVFAQMLGKPIFMLLCSMVAAAVFVYIGHREKKGGRSGSPTVLVVYKMIAIILTSLSLAFLLIGFGQSMQISLKTVIIFFVAGLSSAILISYLTFRESKPFLQTGIIGFTVLISSSLIFGIIPARAQQDAFVLPDKEEIESVRIFLDSMEETDASKHFFDECVDLHELLLDSFREGYLPDEYDPPYKEPECIADVWDTVTIDYKLKDGGTLYRYYRRLNAPAFDAFFIEYLKSDAYAYSLQQTVAAGREIRYFLYGENEHKWCKLPRSCFEVLIMTYCAELKNADSSAFYENYEAVRLIGENNRILYIPLSFTETRELLGDYTDRYAPKG